MPEIRIYADHVSNGPTFNDREPFSGTELLKRLSGIVLRLHASNFHIRNTHGLYIRNDDFAGEFTRQHDILYNAKGLREHDRYPYIKVFFHEARGDDHCYAALAAPDTSTAYKRGRRIPPRETKFKVHSASVGTEKDSPIAWIERECDRLGRIADQLDAARRDVRSWAESGLGMRVVCRGTAACDHASVIGNESLKALAGGSASLDDIKGRLKCSKCGSRSVRIEIG